MQTGLRRYIVRETAISALATATINIAVAILSSGDPATVMRAADLTRSLLPQIFMAALMSALVPLLLTRSRQIHGRLKFRPGDPPQIGRALAVAVLLAVAIALIVVPMLRALLSPLMEEGWRLPAVLLFNAVIGGLIAGLATPAALLAVLVGWPAPRRA